MRMRIMIKPSWYLASVIKKCKGRLSPRRSLTRPRVRNTKARKSTLPSLSLRNIKVIERSLMIKGKRRHGFEILLSPKTRTYQSRCTIIRKKPWKVYWPSYRRNAGRKSSASNVENPVTGGESVMVRL
jgi:hypothetical protein